MEQPWYRREASVILRELLATSVVYESHAVSDGPWTDNAAVIPAMFEAALAGLPQSAPPACAVSMSRCVRSSRPAETETTLQEATRIIAIRHGETAWNVDTRIQGHLDIPLNDTGRWQAQRVAAALAGEPIAAMYASDLQRAHTTAGAIAQTWAGGGAHRPARTRLWRVRGQDLHRDRHGLAR
jgi:hypothetical protein